MKLRNKIHLSSTLLTLVILFILTVVIYMSFSRLTYSTEVERLRGEAEALVSTFHTNEITDPRAVLRAYVPVGGLVKVTGQTGELVPAIQDPAITDDSVPQNLEGTSGTVREGGAVFAYVKAPIIWPDGQVAELLLAQSLDGVSENLQTLRNVLVTVSLLAMIPVVISSIFLGKIVTDPITGLTRTMQRIRRSGRFERLPDSRESQDELGQMGHTFNEMITLLEENYLKQEEFIANASHELKTPITVIQSYARLLQRQGMQKPELAEEGLTAIQAETERMKSLIEQLLLLARRDETQVEWAEIELVGLLAQTVSAMEAAYGREFRLTADRERVLETTDVAKLKQLLYILLDNARKYSSEPVEILVTSQPKTVIRVKDRGIGIPKESLPFVFDRFYRVDKARSRETGGSGLGLSLAKELADSLGLTLEIDSLEGLGTTVSVVFSSNSHFPPINWKQEPEQEQEERS